MKRLAALLLLSLAGCPGPRPDLLLDVSGFDFTLTGPQSVSGVVSFSWTGGEASDVDFEFRNVPPGVSVEETFRLAPGESRTFTFVASDQAQEGVYTVPLVARSKDLVKFARLSLAVRGAPGAIDRSFNGGEPVRFCMAGVDVNAVKLLVEERFVSDDALDSSRLLAQFTLMGRVGNFPAAFRYIPEGLPRPATELVVGTEEAAPVQVRSGVFNAQRQTLILSGRAGNDARLWSLPHSRGFNEEVDDTFGEGGFARVSLPDALDVSFVDFDRLVTMSNVPGTGGDIALEQFDSRGLPKEFTSTGSSKVVLAQPEADSARVLAPGAGRTLYVGGRRIVGVDTFAHVVAVLDDGTLDPAFGSGGVFSHSFGPGRDEVTDLKFVFRPLGVMLAGLSGGQVFVARLSSLGALDPSFGTNGGVLLGAAARNSEVKVLVLPEGDLLVASLEAGGIRLFRLTVAGAPDPAFGSAGSVLVPDNGVVAGPADLAQAPGGRVVLLTNSGGCAVLTRLWL